MPQTRPSRIIDNPLAPDLFATGAAGFVHRGSNIGITFEAVKVDYSSPPGTIHRVVAGRVVMSLEDTQRLVLELFNFLKQRGENPANLILSQGDPLRPQ